MDEASSSCTLTQRLQAELENTVSSLYEAFDHASSRDRAELLRLQHDEHEEFSTRGLRRLSAGFYVLDSSRPWICYWILHSLALMGRSVNENLYDRTVDFLERCQDKDGGYGGGPGQMAHLATTYAATCALVTLGGEKALASLKREKILQFLVRMKDPSGGFRVHDDGEMDMRGSYTALAVAHLLNIAVPELLENVGTYVQSCQSYEGGIGGEPGAEAHGGYTFCGLAALALVNQLHVLDLPSLVNWVAFRQGKVEGGFQGRTNKLVDGCYSFWQGGCFRVLQQYMPPLWAQQTSLSAGLCVSKEDAGSGENFNIKDLESNEPAYSDSERISLREGGVPDSVSREAQTKDGTEATFIALKETLSTSEGSRNTDEQASQPTTEGTTYQPKSVYTRHMKSRGDSDSDDSVEFWRSDRRPLQNTAEKLFPMEELDLGKVQLPLKPAKLVEIFGDQQGAQVELSGASSSSRDSSSMGAEDWDVTPSKAFFNSQALQAYILLCCQDLNGGLRDKPGKSCDFYHTCYCLSGLSVAQYSTANRVGAPPPSSGVVGSYSNLLEAADVLYNVRLDRYQEAQRYFKS